MLFSYGSDPAYYRSRIDLDASRKIISQEYLPGDLVLIKSYGTPAWDYWMNWADPHLPWTSLPFSFPKPDQLIKSKALNDPEIALDEITLSILKKVPGTIHRVWIVIPSDSPGANLDLEVDWLRKYAVSNKLWDFQVADMETRLFLFNISP